MVTTDFLKYVRLMYDKVRFPVQVVEQSGKIVYLNEAFTILWGYHLSELSEYSLFNDRYEQTSTSISLDYYTLFEGNFIKFLIFHPAKLLRCSSTEFLKILN